MFTPILLSITLMLERYLLELTQLVSAPQQDDKGDYWGCEMMYR